MAVLIDLFSGIGGFARGAELAGFKFTTSYHSDIEDYANNIYSRHFPDSIQLGDIRNIDGKALRAKHPEESIILCGGFPCQDISCAGREIGIHGERSGLWFEMLRLIDEIRPEVVVAENVKALCSNGLDVVLRTLAETGYDAKWRIYPAGCAGAPHIRERIFITAWQTSADADLHGCLRFTNSQHPQISDMGKLLESDVQDEGESTWTPWARFAAEAGLHPKSYISRMDDGLSGQLDEIRSRIKALGNAIVPQVAEKVFREIRGLFPHWVF